MKPDKKDEHKGSINGGDNIAVSKEENDDKNGKGKGGGVVAEGGGSETGNQGNWGQKQEKDGEAWRNFKMRIHTS